LPEFLQKILASTREDLEARKLALSLAQLKERVSGDRPRRLLTRAVSSPGISVIAEIKRASPSKGPIRPELDVAGIASAYESAGAAAVSVLTEERYFKGSLDDLRAARAACGLPLLRKDFIIDSYQVWEAAEAGADAVLLIVAALSAEELVSLRQEAEAAGLECLVEVHSLEEMERAAAAGARLIGINNRDLRTFEVSLRTTTDMMNHAPEGVPIVSESGIRGAADVSMLANAGVNAVLVGETLMRSEDPGNALRQLLDYER